jgi:undecaprenyl-diphosphatase
MTFIFSIDTWFENLMLNIRTPFFLEVFKGITFFGSVTTILAIGGLVALYLAYKRYWPYLVGLAVTVGGAGISAFILKDIIARARPGGLIQAVAETSYSFPSGHATSSMALYGFIAFVLCKLYPERKRCVITAATLIILAIGFSRLYLGVHFPSDVLAGFALGGFWLWVGILSTKKSEKCISKSL